MNDTVRKFLLCLILLYLTLCAYADEDVLKNADGTWKWTIRLIDETSPYLLLHAHNPVDWYPWDDEALARAKKEHKLIFLSVGYSTCYWCHVMERKVFSNPEIAAQMNKHFINIKIDREERPDLDEIYMTATQLLTQRGGWPNSVFLTPDLKPFYAGTYFPPTDMPNRPGFPTVLDAVHEAWVTREAEVVEASNQLTGFIEMVSSKGFTYLATQQLDSSVITAAVAYLKSSYSHAFGGFDTAPKFPSPANLEFLLREYQRQSGQSDDTLKKKLDTTQQNEKPVVDESLLKMVTHTLDMMAYGGIYDQIGGGFHRYSVDAKWLVPHFEKMLYDNAQLSKIYLQTYQMSKKQRFRRIAEEIFSFVAREMTSAEGGFYSALDAETDAEEGKYYVWTADEIKDVLSQDVYKTFATIYGIEKGPNFEGKNIIYVPEGNKVETSLNTMKSAREELLAARYERERPLLDTKVIVSWNGLMIDALAYGYEVLGEEKYLTTASEAAHFILNRMMQPNGELWHSFTAGVVKYDAFLDDYAFFVRGLLGIYNATGNKTWLNQAKTLTDKMIELFWDEKHGGFFYTRTDAKQLIVRTKKPHDTAIPSGNAVAVNNLLMLMESEVDTDYKPYVEKTLRSFAQGMKETPSSFIHMLYAFIGYINLDMDEKVSKQSHVTANANIISAKGSMPIQVELKVKVADGWHINANPASQVNLISTTVTVAADAPLEIAEVKYPIGKSVQFAFSDETLKVYDKTITISVKLKQKTNANVKKEKQIVLKLNYQACNETSCLLPETLDIPLTLD